MLLIRWPHPTQINTKRSQTTTGSHSIGHSQSGTGSDKTGRKHPDTDTQIKRGQISRSRRSTHIMWSDIDKEALESRNPYPYPIPIIKAQTKKTQDWWTVANTVNVTNKQTAEQTDTQ